MIPLDRAAVTSDAGVLEVLRQAGEPLDPGVRQTHEARLGTGLEGVRIHRGEAASRSAGAIGAAAYASGNHVVFGEGAYRPGTAAGDRVLAHELTHVLQQASGPVSGSTTGHGFTLSHPGDPHERAAASPQQAGMFPAGGARHPGQTGGGRGSPPAVQRFDSFEHIELGDTARGGPSGLIVLEAHRRDLPNHATPTVGWPPEWVALWAHGTAEQRRAIRDGLTYGEVVALSGDLYASVDRAGTTSASGSFDRLNHASLRELWDLIPLIHGTSTGTGELERATGGRYIDLARRNLSHFSNVPAGQSNIDVWREGHLQAIRLASSGQADVAWAMNAASDHFLTDAFAGGHLREARARLVGSSPGQIIAKAVHDLDNEAGVDVFNRRGDRWTAFGDDHLDTRVDATNRRIAIEAVALSKSDIEAAITQGASYPVPPTFSAEALVPSPVSAAASHWGGAALAAELGHLAYTELPEQLIPNGDTRIREWTARQPPAALRDVPLDDRLRMINRLLDGWVSDDDLDAIDRLCANAPSQQLAEVEGAITPRVTSLTSHGQRARLRAILARRN